MPDEIILLRADCACDLSLVLRLVRIADEGAGIAQRRDPVLGIADLAQNLGAMLPQNRCGPRDRARRLGKLDRQPDGFDRARQRMRRLDDHLPRNGLRIRVHLGDGEHPAIGQRFSDMRPKLIIHCGAMASGEGCANQPPG